MGNATEAAEERTTQRADPSHAESVFKTLLPDDGIRREACDLMARDVIAANSSDAGKWGVTLKRALARLNVGGIEVLTIYPEVIHLIADRTLVDRASLEAAGCVLRPEDDEPFYQRVQDSLAVNFEGTELSTALPLVAKAHSSLIAKAAATTVHSMTARAHSPGVLRYLEKVTGMVLPDPQYSTSTSAPKLAASTLTQLFAEFQSTYWKSDKGRLHQGRYAAARATAATNFANAARLAKDGADLTNAVLNGMLPHGDSKGNRGRGAWIHVAPAVTKDARMLFEGAGWVKPEEWPTVSRRVFEFFSKCSERPAELEGQCASLGLKGFQSGMLSPFLNALRPDEFLIINTKSLALINALGSQRFRASITDYPSANRTGRDLVAGNPEIQAAASREQIPACDVFDAFSHWLYAEKKWWDPKETQYWKIAPGANAEYWGEWKAGGYAAIAWNELGDLSGLSKDEFEPLLQAALKEHADWAEQGATQAFQFAHIPEGSMLVANKGTSLVLGIGRVTGPYEYVEDGSPYRHHLPVEWFDLKEREVEKGGWRRTLVRLAKDDFEMIRDSKGETPKGGRRFGPRTFELLGLLDKEPTAAVYQAQKEDFKRWVEEPFQALFRAVAAALPSEVKALLETEERIFSRILKNDYGKGGAWPFYWGAFYPKGGERTADVQLFATARPAGITIGFGFGDRSDERFETLKERLEKMSSAEFDAVRGNVASHGLKFRVAGDDPREEIPTLDAWLNHEERVNVSGVIPAGEVITTPLNALAERVSEAFVAAFPLVLAALGKLTEPYRPSSGGQSLLGETQAAYGLDKLIEETGFAAATLETWLRILRQKKQIVLQGPPGTGKTYLAQRLAQVLVAGTNGLNETVQFHPAYAYEDFIQGIRPEATDGGLSYRLEPGRFVDFCTRAAKRSAPCILVIDEINRANVARVFGELMYLFEYRKSAVPLAAGGQPFRVPENVHVIGTMNTADRSIARMDYALRRRFAFIRLRPEYDVLQRHLDSFDLPAASLISVLKGINKAMEDPNFELGISYFMRGSDLRAQMRDVWECEIEPYLEEYFYDQPKKIEAWRWTRLVENDLQDWA